MRKLNGRARYLHNGASWSRERSSVTAESRNSVPIMMDRIDAGVMREAVLDQNLECPQGAARDRVTRGPIGGRPHPASVLNGMDGSLSVVAKLGRRQVINQAV